MRSQSFLRHAAIYGLGTILIQAAGFFLIPLYTWYLSPSDYGILEVLNRLAEVLIIGLLFGGLRQATLAFHGQSKDQTERQQTVATLIVLLAGISLLGSVAIYWYAEPVAACLSIAEPGLLALAVTAALLEASMMVLLALCQARQESTWYVGITVSQFLVRAGLIIVLVSQGWGVWGILTASGLVSGIYALGLAVREIAHGAWRPSRARLRGMIAFALPLLPGGLGFFVLNNGDRFFLKEYAGAEAVGTYALGYKLALVVSLLGKTPFAMVWSARMYEAAKQLDAPQVFGRLFTRMLGVYLLLGLGLALFAGEAIAVLGGSRYAAAAGIIAPIILAYLFLTAADLMDSGFYVTRRTVHKSWIVVVSTAAMLLLYATFIPTWGALGAALATLAGFVIHAVLTGLTSQRVFPVHYEPFRLAAMLGLAIGLWLLGQTLPAEIWSIPVKVGLWLLWPVLLWSLGLIATAEKTQLQDQLGRVRTLLQPMRTLRLFGGVR